MAASNRHSALRLLIIAIGVLPGIPLAASDPIVLSVNRVALDPLGAAGPALTRVNFQQAYTVTPAVFILPDETNPDPSTVRIVSVDTTGFDAAVFEPANEDGSTSSTTIDYFAVEPFARDFGGIEMEAGIITGFGTEIGRNIGAIAPQAVSFSRAKNGTPIVLAQIQSAANQPAIRAGLPANPWMTASADNASSAGFDLAIERSEDSGALSTPETIAWFAIDANVDFDILDTSDAAVQGRSTLTPDTIVGHNNGCVTAALGRTFATAPRIFGNKNSRDGSDGGWLRRCSSNTDSVDLVVDEDRLADTERSHTTEEAGLLAFQRTFTALRTGPLSSQKPFNGEVGDAFIPAATVPPAQFTDVSFSEPFLTPPLVFTIPTEVDPAPATIRIRNVTTDGFQVAAIEPEGEAGSHDPMTIDYIAVVAGTHRLDDGRRIEANFVDTARFQANQVAGASWDAIAFTVGYFTSAPAMITQIQTTANEPAIDPSNPSQPFLTSVMRSITSTGADIALERSETSAGSITTNERIGWLAAETNVHGTLVANDGGTVEYDFSTGATVRGFDDGCFAASYFQPFTSAPLAVADKNDRLGNNGGWLRRCSGPASASVGLHVDEDRANDSERLHIAEPVSIFAFERAFDWAASEPDIVLMKSSLVLSDPVNTQSNPKRNPGALIDYTITATNLDKASTDPDSIVVTDLLPDRLELFLGDVAAGAPIEFDDGGASGLSFTFIAVDSPLDDLEFTDDAGASPIDWTYQPSVVDDFDPAVEGFRIRPSGAFAGQTGATPPSFDLRYRTRLD